MADGLVRVEDVTSHEGELVGFVVAVDILGVLSSIGNELLEGAALAQILDELRVLSTDLVNEAFLLH